MPLRKAAVTGEKLMQKEDIIIQEGREQDELRLAGIMSKGYGIIPKVVMLDRRLSDKAKAIYAFFCSFAGARNSAFPKVSTICHYLKMNKDTYYKHFKQLVELGYIEVHQARDEEGKFSHNIYILKQEVYLPVEEEKVSEKKPKKDDKNMDTTKKSPSPKKSDTVNSDTNNNRFINNKKGNSNNRNNYHSFILSKEEEEKERQKEEEINQIFVTCKLIN
ncbi:helix-turn-helix domain-containing protein [Parageobacillus thermantarcticus]|uniref:helix-turn-helix domain-containing protein n=1 Tax=Parageobacillus thermantarcticus TaxID=186116 RepID=UPI0011606C83|nr:helix-turn-helix domain-containing protein [Parageobacillus thermantarcticus]